MSGYEEVLTITNKAYELGRVYHSQALTAISLCGKNGGIAQTQMKKVSIFVVELRKQLHVVSKIIKEIHGASVEFSNNSKKTAAKYTMSKDRLDSILLKLNEATVGVSIPSDNKSPNNLFDYVNSDSLMKLREETDQAVASLLDVSNDIVKERVPLLSGYTKRVDHLQQEVDRIDNPARHRHVVEILQGVDRDSTSLYNTLDSLSKDLSRVRELKSQDSLLSSNSSSGSSEEDKSLVDDLPEKVEKLAIGLEKIMKENAKLEEIVKEINEMKNVALDFFLKVEEIGDELRANFKNSADLMEIEKETDPSNAIEEMKNLSIWYEKYLSSYHNLVKEHSRRIQYEESVKRRVHDFSETLRNLDQEECQRRRLFAERNGHFLPPFFSAYVSQLPVQYKILASSSSRSEAILKDDK